MNEENIKEIFSDEEFVKSLPDLETPEEVQKALEEKGIDLSIDEIKELAVLIKRRANGELSDEELTEISGGLVVSAILLGLMIGTVYIMHEYNAW